MGSMPEEKVPEKAKQEVLADSELAKSVARQAARAGILVTRSANERWENLARKVRKEMWEDDPKLAESLAKQRGEGMPGSVATEEPKKLAEGAKLKQLAEEFLKDPHSSPATEHSLPYKPKSLTKEGPSRF